MIEMIMRVWNNKWSRTLALAIWSTLVYAILVIASGTSVIDFSVYAFGAGAAALSALISITVFT